MDKLPPLTKSDFFIAHLALSAGARLWKKLGNDDSAKEEERKMCQTAARLYQAKAALFKKYAYGSEV